MATREDRYLGHRHRAQSIIQWNSLDQLEEEVIQGLYENADHHKGSSKQVVICETFYGYLWWTVFQLLTVQICHPSLFIPSISSFLLFPVISVALLLFCFIFTLEMTRPLLSSPLGLLILRLLSLLPILYVQFSNPLFRLIIFCVGGPATLLAVTGNWWEMSTIDRHRKIFYHFLGFILFLVLKLWSGTFNPLLNGSYISTTLLILSVVVVFMLFILDERTPILRINDILKTHSPNNFQPVVIGKHMWVWLGVGFGCQLLIVQLIFADASTLLRWSGSIGVTICPCLVIVCLCFGLSCGIERNLYFVTSSQWLAIGVISYLIFTASTGPASYLGGLILSIYLSGIWPQLCCRVTEAEPYKVLPVAVATYVLLAKIGSCQLFGFSLAEGILLPVLVAQWKALEKWVEFGLQAGRIRRPSEGTKTLKKKPSQTMILGHMIRKLSTVMELEEDLEEEELVKERKSVHQQRMRQLIASETEEIKKFDRQSLKKALLFLGVFGILGSAYCSMPSSFEEKKIDHLITVSSLLLNAGYDTKGFYNAEEITKLVQKSGSNVVCLFDATREFSGDIMSASIISEKLSMHMHHSQQRNPRVAILTNMAVESISFSNREGVALSLRTGADAEILLVTCQNARIPDYLVKESPSVFISARKWEDSSVNNKLHTFSGCDGSYIYFNSLMKHSQSCINTAGLTSTNMTTLTLSRTTGTIVT